MGENEHQYSRDYSIDIDKLEEEISEPAVDCCIYRVPQYLRRLNEEAYSPSLISIGPLHHGSEELKDMEMQKRRYRFKFKERVGLLKLGEFETYIRNHEQPIRDHYAVSSTLESTEYVAMILCDVVFIIELFVRYYEGSDDFLLVKPPLTAQITRDLLLFENQLPYFVLDDLYSPAFPSSEDNPSFFALCRIFFDDILGKFNCSFSENPQVKHFTDFLRRAVVLEVQPAGLKSGEISDLPSATKLNESGLKFKRTEGKCLLDITMGKRKLRKWLPWRKVNEVQIPRIKIYDDTECLLRNLMALEVFHYPTQTYVCHYAELLDYLIDTAKDVDLLSENGIIANCLGDKEAIGKMFNTLCSQITPSDSCYYGIAEDMKTHYNNPWNKAKATLISVYFKDLWTGTATVGAIIVVILTFIQTVSSLQKE